MRSSSSQHFGHTLLWSVLAGVAGGLLLVPSVALAKKFDQLPVKMELRNDLFSVLDVLRGDTSLDENREMFDQFFHEFVFAQLTVFQNPPRPDGKRGRMPADMGKIRRDLTRYLRDATDESARVHANELTFAAMKDLIVGNYHPGTRYNATLIVGDLDQQPSRGYGPGATPPVPLAEAAPYLLGMLADDDMVDVVKVAALIGLERHARYGLADSHRSQATVAALALINQSTPPGDRSSESHTWMRHQAADLLAILGEVGPQNQVVKAMHGMLAEKGAPRSLRCAAATTLGRLQYGPESAADATATFPDLIRLAIESCKEYTALGTKLEYQESLNPRRPVRRPQLGIGDPLLEEPIVSVFPRRQLATVLSCVGDGLKAISAVAEPNQKAAVADVMAKMDEAMKLLADKKKPDKELIKAFTKSCGELETALKNLNAPPGSVTPEPEDATAAEDQDLFGAPGQ